MDFEPESEILKTNEIKVNERKYLIYFLSQKIIFFSQFFFRNFIGIYNFNFHNKQLINVD